MTERLHGKLVCPVCGTDEYPEIMLSRHLWQHGHRPTLIKALVEVVTELTLVHRSTGLGPHDQTTCLLCQKRPGKLDS